MSTIAQDPTFSTPLKPVRRTFSELVPTLPAPGSSLVIHGLDWKDYQTISEHFTARPAWRIAYDRGTLEIMPTSFLHEKLSLLFARIIHVLCDELTLLCASAGSTTLDREDLDKGIEPDQCFYIVNEPLVRHLDHIDLSSAPPPDLGIEVNISRSSINRLGIYAAIGIPEAWRFDGEKIEVRHLTPGGDYVIVPASRYFPTIPMAEIASVLLRRHETDEGSLMRSFRERVRELIAAKTP